MVTFVVIASGVIDGEEFEAPPVRFDKKGQAAAFCWENGIPYFYQMDEYSPFSFKPSVLWELKEDRTKSKGYRLKGRNWSSVQAEGCTCGCGGTPH